MIRKKKDDENAIQCWQAAGRCLVQYQVVRAQNDRAFRLIAELALAQKYVQPLTRQSQIVTRLW